MWSEGRKEIKQYGMKERWNKRQGERSTKKEQSQKWGKDGKKVF